MQPFTARWTLSRKILGLALLNLSLLALALLVFARSQFQLGTESLLLGPARERIAGIADSFAFALQSAPASSRDSLFAAYAKRYGADVFLADPQGHFILGPKIVLPRELMEQINAPALPPDRRPRPGGGPGRGRGPRGGEQGPGPPPPRAEDPPPPRPQDGPVPPPQPPRNAPFLVITHNPTRYWAGARVPLHLAEWEQQRPAVLLLRSASMFNSALFFDWRLWMAAAVSAFAITALCWLPFVRGITRSVSAMDRVTEQIAEGRFGDLAPVTRSDELGHLAAQINRMAARLEGFVKNQKRFLGDIAHELCAPIARIQFALGILEQKAAADPAEVSARLKTLYDEIQEMSGLVNELLSFSKAGMNPDAVPLEAVNLEAVAQRAMAREAFAGAEIRASIPAGLTVMANEAFLLRAVSNVLRNAVRYAGKDGPIEIRAERQGSEGVLTIADCGPGLPEMQLEEVFQPFYRPEAARTRETGGAGLGLAIVKSCVEACRGAVECRNRRPRGLEVILRLPVTPLH